MIVKERLYLTADRKKVVKEGDKTAAYLFAAAGQEMPDNVARQYGLTKAVKEKQKPENKQVELSENKQIEISETKEEDDG